MKPLLRRVNGILLLDKPAGITSNGALQRVKRLFMAKKAGHTGSLDPLATGMLPICFGEATRVSQFLLESDKRYEVRAILGVRTKTGDAEGEVTETRPVPVLSDGMIADVLERFRGVISQVPPMFSAIKYQGKPLYRLARQGIEIERAPRAVRIDLLELRSRGEGTLDVEVRCSKGTYIRTLIEDIGEALQCGAHVGRLRRTEVVPYQAADMAGLDLDGLQALFEKSGFAALDQLLLPVDTPIQHLPFVRLSSAAAFYLRGGQPVMVPNAPASGFVRIYEGSGFMGVGEMSGDGKVMPRRLVTGSALPVAHVPQEAAG